LNFLKTGAPTPMSTKSGSLQFLFPLTPSIPLKVASPPTAPIPSLSSGYVVRLVEVRGTLAPPYILVVGLGHGLGTFLCLSCLALCLGDLAYCCRATWSGTS
jgi:hypothetical protein